MSKKTNTCILLLSALACTCVNAMSSQAREATLSYQLARAADDARVAASLGDLRLLALGLRVLSIPGVDQLRHPEAASQCGTRIIAANDVIENDSRRSSLQERSEYAMAYNRIMLPLCMEENEVR